MTAWMDDGALTVARPWVQEPAMVAAALGTNTAMGLDPDEAAKRATS